MHAGIIYPFPTTASSYDKQSVCTLKLLANSGLMQKEWAAAGGALLLEGVVTGQHWETGRAVLRHSREHLYPDNQGYDL
jgi:hypothetical protein